MELPCCPHCIRAASASVSGHTRPPHCAPVHDSPWGSLSVLCAHSSHCCCVRDPPYESVEPPLSDLSSLLMRIGNAVGFPLRPAFFFFWILQFWQDVFLLSFSSKHLKNSFKVLLRLMCYLAACYFLSNSFRFSSYLSVTLVYSCRGLRVDIAWLLLFWICQCVLCVLECGLCWSTIPVSLRRTWLPLLLDDVIFGCQLCPVDRCTAQFSYILLPADSPIPTDGEKLMWLHFLK